MKLFNKLKFEDFATSVIRNSVEEVKSIKTSNNDIEEKANAIVENFKFTVPELLKEKTESEIKLEEDDNGKQKAIAVFNIPFEGNHEIFNITPTLDSIDLPEDFELKKDTIILKIKTDSDNLQLSNEWQQYIIDESRNIIARIEANLAALQLEYIQFKSELFPLTVNLLLAREQELLGKEAVERNINTFGTQETKEDLN